MNRALELADIVSREEEEGRKGFLTVKIGDAGEREERGTMSHICHLRTLKRRHRNNKGFPLKFSTRPSAYPHFSRQLCRKMSNDGKQESEASKSVAEKPEQAENEDGFLPVDAMTMVAYCTRGLAPAVLEYKGLHMDQGFLVNALKTDTPKQIVKRTGVGGKSIKAVVFIDLKKAVDLGIKFYMGPKQASTSKAKCQRLTCSKVLIPKSCCTKYFSRPQGSSFREVNLTG
jgi:hypothetical protein